MNTEIYEQATNWLIKHREGDLDPEEKWAFDAWLRESPQNVRAYLEMSAVWEDVPALDVSWNPMPEELVGRARIEGNIYPLADSQRVTAKDPDSRSFSSDFERPSSREGNEFRSAAPLPSGARGAGTVPRASRARPFALAALLVIAVAGVTTWYRLYRNTYVTDIGEQRSIVLGDGSTVELDSRSRVRIRYSDSQREVDLLQGQALFRVTHNAARPFIVHSGTASVRAVGTQFDVYRKRAGTLVTVVEGRVAVLASNLATPGERADLAPAAGRDVSPAPRKKTEPVGDAASGAAAGIAVYDLPVPPWAASAPRGALSGGSRNAIFLAAGEQLIVPAVEPSQAGRRVALDRPQRADVAAATAWTSRILVFESSPLTDVVDEFNRYNTRQLVIMDPDIAAIHISGRFSSVDPALLLKFLRTQRELNVEETETEIRISKRRE